MKKLIALVLSLMFVLSCAGAMAENSPYDYNHIKEPIDTSVTGEFTYWSCFSGDSLLLDEWRVDQFMKAYPNVKVDLQFVPESAGMNNGKLMAAIAGGTAPDLVIADNYYLAYGFGAQGMLEDMTPYFDKIDYAIDEFMPGYSNLMTFNDGTYLLPQDSNVIFIYMNNKLFEAAGLDPAVDYPKTIEELDALAEKLTVTNEAGEVTSYGYIPWLDSGDDALYWPFMFGGKIYDAETNKLDLAAQPVVDCFNWMNKYAQKYGAENIKGFTQAAGGLFSPDHPFFTEKVAMTMIGNWATNALRVYAPHVEYTVCPIPVPEGGRANSTPLGSNVFAIPYGAKRPDLAALFMNFCIRADINGANYDVWRSIPTIDPVFDEVSWTIKGDPIYLMERELANSPLSGHPGLCTVSTELNTEMKALRDDVIYNNKDPKPLLEALQVKLQDLLDNPVW
ncbi:MAG: extracellular solute-binding protein [bacterium]|nr:extracellular solute-binding protein [bacterium]